MKKILLPIVCLLAMSTLEAQNEAPYISNLVVTADTDNEQLIISYTLFDTEGDDVQMEMKISTDGGNTFSIDVNDAIGDVGYPVTPDGAKQITWNYGSAGIANIGQARVKTHCR